MSLRLNDIAPDFQADTTQGTIHAEAKELYAEGWKTLKPYLRYVPQPGK